MESNLISIDFKFEGGYVIWKNKGKGEVNGRTYPRTYLVFVYNNKGEKQGEHLTSFQANISNSIRFLTSK